MADFYKYLKDFIMGIDSSAKNVFEVLDEIFFFWAK